MSIYLKLIWAYLKIGLFGFGGGYAMLSLIQREVVDSGWISSTTFTDIVAISQMTPGPIGINCATYAGYLATGGVLGSLVATVAVVLPSFIIMLIVAKMLAKFKNNVYVEGALRGLRPVVVGLIAAAALLLMNEENFGEHCADYVSWLIFAVAFVAVKFLKINPILMIVLAAVAGLIIY